MATENRGDTSDERGETPPPPAGSIVAPPPSIVVARLRHTLQQIRPNAEPPRETIEEARALAADIESLDGFTHGHADRVAALAESLGMALELPLARLRRLSVAALLHDIGMVGIPHAVLTKAQRLTPEEFEVMKTHSTIGESLLREIDGHEDLCTAVRHAHERFDGSGYPDHLGSGGIPILARIIGAAEAWDTIVTPRLYKAAVPASAALEELWRCRGTHFDPDVVDALYHVFTAGRLPLVAGPRG